MWRSSDSGAVVFGLTSWFCANTEVSPFLSNRWIAPRTLTPPWTRCRRRFLDGIVMRITRRRDRWRTGFRSREPFVVRPAPVVGVTSANVAGATCGARWCTLVARVSFDEALAEVASDADALVPVPVPVPPTERWDVRWTTRSSPKVRRRAANAVADTVGARAVCCVGRSKRGKRSGAFVPSVRFGRCASRW